MLPPPPYNIILFELDFNVKFPLLRLLQFLSDSKNTFLGYQYYICRGYVLCIFYITEYIHKRDLIIDQQIDTLNVFQTSLPFHASNSNS